MLNELIPHLVVTAINVILMGAGLYTHFRVFMARQKERDEWVERWLYDLNKRIYEIEHSRHQTNGSTTYIPRRECDRRTQEYKERLNSIASCQNDIKQRLTRAESLVGKRRTGDNNA